MLYIARSMENIKCSQICCTALFSTEERLVYRFDIGTRGINHNAAILEVLHGGAAEDDVSWDVTVCGVVHIYRP